LRRDYDIEVRWVAFPLHPYIPEEGLTLEELFTGRPVDIEEMKTRWREAARDVNLSLADPKKVCNTRLAQELGKWAELQRKGDEYHTPVCRAFFPYGKDIGNIPELADLVKSLGLSDREAQKVLETRAFAKAVEADWSRSHEMGVRSVPTFVVNRRGVSGGQPYLVLKQLMTVCNVKKRDSYP
jgi:predicted DsbA family dithiol-disulfide isomerase